MVVAESSSYEEIRRKRIQENLKHLEELGVSKISKDLLEEAEREHKITKCHTSPKPKKIFETSELRRSSRARNPAVIYCEEVVERKPVSVHRRRSTNSNPERAYTGRIASYQQIAAAIKRAEKLQKDLKSPHPSFVKTMLRSHVSSCFWLGLPSKFCKDNLPLHELRMVLEDEMGKEYDAIYIGKRTGLSGGWRGFALDHNLEDGDALIFELSEPERFKIYIIKAIKEEPSETNNDETTENTAALTPTESITQEEDLPVSRKQPPKTGSRKQPKKIGAGKQTRKATKKRKHKVQPDHIA